MTRNRRTGGRDAQLSDCTYEFAVSGALGPVLGHALSGQRPARTQRHTVFRAQLAEETDLVEVIGILESKGVKFEGVIAIGTD